LLGDVLFNSYRLALLKRSSAFLTQAIGVGCHSGVHFFFAAILLFLGDRPWIRGALTVFVCHFFIDLLRSSVERKKYGQGRIHVKRSEFVAWVLGKSENSAKMNFRDLRPWFLINIFDQGAHLACLLAIALRL
ncbi:MAG: DUF3307 domain-containing protein, partial [Desulfobacterales bacterium]|nr:DUF3307 domain-containing protein [Desulfobacterales bacterium]